MPFSNFKLIPVTKFLLNILESRSETRSETIKIVFDSFITYLNGLPKAISLFSQLTCNHAKFISFLEVSSPNSRLKFRPKSSHLTGFCSFRRSSTIKDR